LHHFFDASLDNFQAAKLNVERCDLPFQKDPLDLSTIDSNHRCPLSNSPCLLLIRRHCPCHDRLLTGLIFYGCVCWHHPRYCRGVVLQPMQPCRA
jgi:hypothetical protein